MVDIGCVAFGFCIVDVVERIGSGDEMADLELGM
jgi:hypothetical protein